MKKVKPVIARNSGELAKVVGLSPADGKEIEFRRNQNDKSVAKKRLKKSDGRSQDQSSRK